MTCLYRLVFGFCVYVAVVPSAVPGGEGVQDPSSVCDDGKYKIEKDLGKSENWECQGGQFQITQFLQPSYHEECTTTVAESNTECMDTAISYDDHPPSSGNHRPLRPKYGDYKYLPPQRWLAALKYGAVVFLYHPCAPPDQVAEARQLVQSCLWRHFISPYPHLDSDQPMALVSWGCVLRIRWVETEVLRDWISSHALHTPLAADVTTDGGYDKDLLTNATRIEIDGKEVVCPHSHPSTLPDLPTPTHHSTVPEDSKQDHPEIKSAVTCSVPPAPIVTTPLAGDQNSPSKQAPPQTNNSSNCSLPPTPTCCVNQNTYLLVHNNVGFGILITAVCVVLLAAIAVFIWHSNVCTRNSRHSRRGTRYKSVSKFFPFSYGQQLSGSSEGVAIPEYGLPKTGRAEREMLLDESEEDEI